LADEISLIDHPIFEDVLTLYILNGLGTDLCEIAGHIPARERPFAFEELHDLLISHDVYLRHLKASSHQLIASANYTYKRAPYGKDNSFFKTPTKPHLFDRSYTQRNKAPTHYRNTENQRDNNKNHGPRRFPPKCQLCDRMGHTAKHCSRIQYNTPTTNCTSTSSAQDTKWLIDSAASHNIIGDLANLSIHSEYDGTDEVSIGDGSGLPVSHISSLLLHSPNRTFHLNDTLCVPNIQKILYLITNLLFKIMFLLSFTPLFFLLRIKSRERFYSEECVKMVYPPFRSQW
jgi:hypothetical protein